MEANMARSNEKSHMIIENKKRKRLEEIFTCLDSDGDGQISSTKIDIASVGTDVLEAFAPLLCEMEELGQTLTLEDFLEAADKLLKVCEMVNICVCGMGCSVLYYYYYLENLLAVSDNNN